MDTKSDREDWITIDEIEYNKIPFDVEEIGKYKSEDEYMNLTVELFKEMISITDYNSTTMRLDENNNPRRWTRDEAVLGGMMVRLTKILMGITDLTCQRKWEIAYIFVRPVIETCVNLKLLLKNNSEELFQEYFRYSLKVEKELLDLIESNVKDRESELPIESRMKKSILRSFSDSGYSPDDIDPKKIRDCGGKVFMIDLKRWDGKIIILFLSRYLPMQYMGIGKIY